MIPIRSDSRNGVASWCSIPVGSPRTIIATISIAKIPEYAKILSIIRIVNTGIELNVSTRRRCPYPCRYLKLSASAPLRICILSVHNT